MTNFESEKEQYYRVDTKATGSYENFEQSRVIIFPLGRYEVKVEVSPKNEFIGVVEIKINNPFKEFKEKSTPVGYHDVEASYRELG